MYQLELVGYDNFNTQIYEEVLFKKLEMIIVPKDLKVIKDGVQYIESKHFGLTVDKTIKKGMVIKGKGEEEKFIVENVNNIARLSQITLRMVMIDE
ncbi:hypothetical protein [Turicibacter sanguinis]|uniref:hypothetical protein n=1 Tax=Turicibacter sanguinis TaxID=154288 RepID=UPI0006C34D59|nr:hypothetical protein [Turicibacter sanguinis]MDB8438604.1 hypothetical protein [Turicibacter sanguinis]MTO25194.1 hypothetical protein [Turicibacter sanguinis]MTO28096.1 hypothetical protein [Turicibacter sanguinis]MTO91005.1 hypothetical protein [Turicibacter sanguinis]MTQ02766.1 hypothetical protein [Turicibacter sanguinis]